MHVCGEGFEGRRCPEPPDPLCSARGACSPVAEAMLPGVPSPGGGCQERETAWSAGYSPMLPRKVVLATETWQPGPNPRGLQAFPFLYVVSQQQACPGGWSRAALEGGPDELLGL